MYYFASDIHLGAGTAEHQREVESRFVAWLYRVAEDAEAIFLCGDIFDFWFEYKRVIPKGFSRTLGALSALTDRGVRVVFMAGNHDMWVRDYLTTECGVELYTSPEIFRLGERVVHVAHGDNLNVKGDWKLKLMNTVFRSPLVFSLASALVHPNLMMRFGGWWSGKSRHKKNRYEGLPPIENGAIQALIEYAKRVQEQRPCDMYIYGHLHIPFDYSGEGLRVLFTNNWESDPQFARLTREGVLTLERV